LKLEYNLINKEDYYDIREKIEKSKEYIKRIDHVLSLMSKHLN